MGTRYEGDAYHAGTETFKAIVLPTGTAAPVSNMNIAAGAAIATSKQVHKHRKGYAQPNTTATTETRGIHVCIGATGTIVAFKAGSIVACIGAATITIDLKKNGASILTAVITLDSANTARVVEAASIATPGLVVGDWLEIVITATAGGGTIGTGLYVELEIDEDAQ